MVCLEMLEEAPRFLHMISLVMPRAIAKNNTVNAIIGPGFDTHDPCKVYTMRVLSLRSLLFRPLLLPRISSDQIQDHSDRSSRSFPFSFSVIPPLSKRIMTAQGRDRMTTQLCLARQHRVRWQAGQQRCMSWELLGARAHIWLLRTQSIRDVVLQLRSGGKEHALGVASRLGNCDIEARLEAITQGTHLHAPRRQ